MSSAIVRLVQVIATVAALVAGTRAARAHPLDMGYVRIESKAQTVTVSFDLESSIAAHLVDAPALDAGATTARATELANASYRLAPLVTNTGPCTWTTTTAELRAETKTVAQVGTAECPAGSATLRWELPVFAKLPSTFEMLVKSYAFGHEHITIVRPASPVLAIDGASAAYGFTDLVWSGVEHIGAAPGEWHDARGWKLADGIDHVLFLLALLIAGGTLWQLLGIATGFTLGHSVTLALGTFGIFQVSPAIIEPLIALTIAATALEAMIGRFTAHRWKIATAFGFIHGFAFASALGELELATGSAAVALFGFNLGVELGQLAVIVVTAPLILALHRYRPDAARIAVRVVGGLIFVAGMYWFVERTFL